MKIAWGLTGYGPLPYMPVYTSHLRAIAFASRAFEVDVDLVERVHADEPTMRAELSARIGGVGATDRMYTHSAENRLVEELLGGDCTHLFLTEMDMILPKHTLVALAELAKPVASGLYFLRGGRGQPCLYRKVVALSENPYAHSPVRLFPKTHPFQVDCPGLGCVLIHRSVFERLTYPWFDLAEGKFGSDMYFYTKVREAGIEVWAHPGVACNQIDYQVVGWHTYQERLDTDPEFAANGYIIGR